MEIIAVVGESNSGKNGSIMHAMKRIVGLQQSVVLYASCLKGGDRKNPKDKNALVRIIDERIEAALKSDRNIDRIIVEYKKKTIALTTYGDSIGDIKQSLAKSVKEVDGKIDVFICARHSNNNVEEELQNENLKIISVRKVEKKRVKESSSTKQMDDANSQTGDEIVECLDKLF